MKNISVSNITIIFLLILIGCTSQPPGRKELNEGASLHRQKKYEAALTKYQKALELDKNNVNTLYNIGAVYYEMKNYDKSKEYLNKTLDIRSYHNNANYLLAAIYLSEKDFQNSYNHIIKTGGKDKADFFRAFVRILIDNGYYFNDTISLQNDQPFEPPPKNYFSWTDWKEYYVDFTLFIKTDGTPHSHDTKSKRDIPDKFQEFAERKIENLHFNTVKTTNGESFIFQTEGKLYMDAVETEIKINYLTFHEIMDGNLIRILQPGIEFCWIIAAIDNIGIKGEVITELTVSPDGSVKEWETISRYQAPESVAKCIGARLEELKLNSFGEKRTLRHRSSF